MMSSFKEKFHILIISNGFPNYYNPLDGIFYFDQAIALKKTFPDCKIGFIAVNPVGIKDFLKKPNIFKFGTKRFMNTGVNFVHFSYLNIPVIPNFDIKIANCMFPKLYDKYAKKFGSPHIIHVHAYEAGLAAIYLKEKYQIPYLITEHSSKFVNQSLTSIQEKIAQKVFLNSSLNIAVSNYFAEKLNAKFNLPFISIANLVKMEEFGESEVSNKKYQIISIGNFNDNKNQILLLQTIEKYRFGKVLLVGEGVNEIKLRTFVKENNLENMVDFLPFQSRQKLFSLIKQSLCLAITSNHETFGVVAIEAMACGVPVISTKAGGPNDIIINGVNGYIIESNADSFYEAYCLISENLPKFAPDILINYANSHFSENAISQKLINLYKSILAQNEQNLSNL
jgi:glycosyltransferase involved in cell wall biosynthesis